MEPIKINSKKLDTIVVQLANGDDEVVGSYLFKGIRVQISKTGVNKYQASAGRRLKRIYHERRALGLCVTCGVKVKEKNPRTNLLYRMCPEHRAKKRYKKVR